MHLDLNQFRITEEELEQLITLDVSDYLAITAARVIFFKDFSSFISLLMTEILVTGLTVILLVPICLIAQRNISAIPITPAETLPLILVLSLLVLTVVFVWNIYFWKHAVHLKPMAQTISQVEKFNDVIDAIHLADQLALAQSTYPPENTFENRRELLKALKTIRSSLVQALKAMQCLKANQIQHQASIERRYEILVNLDHNLKTLMTLGNNPGLNDYSQLLNKALQIGISVHRELRNI